MHVPGVTGNRKHTMALSVSLYGSTYSKLGLFVLGLGTVFHIIGFSVPDWQRLDTVKGSAKRGLWKECSLETCNNLPDQPGWLLAVQVLESFSLALEIFGLVGVACYMYRGSRIAAYLTAILSVLAGITTLIGTVIYWADHDKEADLYWGFAFEVIGALNCFAAAGLFIYEGKKRTGYVSIR